MEWDLLEKTTFWIEGIELANANLGAVAGAAAVVLGMEPEEVMVVDVRPGLVAFDVLRRRVEAAVKVIRPGITEKRIRHAQGGVNRFPLPPAGGVGKAHTPHPPVREQ